MGRKLRAFASGLILAAGLLILMPSIAWAADPSGSAFTTTTDGNATTYTFTTLHNVNASNSYGAQTFRVDADGDVVLDFTHVPQSEVADAEFILDLTADNLTVTVKGDPAVDYGNSAITIYSKPYVNTLSVTLELEDFQTGGTVTNNTNDEDQPFKVSFDGACRVSTITADYLELSAADDAASLSLESSLWDGGALTMKGGTYQMGYHYISYPQVTIKDANITFSQGSGSIFDSRYIQAEQLTIENSTIQGVANVYSVERHGEEYKKTFAGSSITVKNSTITYAEKVTNSYYVGMLCNAETISIEGSTITGAASTASIACVGGVFKTLTIKGSELYIESDCENDTLTAPAIGPDWSSYTSYMGNLGITNPIITIENSIVEAASRYSAAIGLPRLNSTASTTGMPQLSIVIKGDSNITATSVYSPAIGGGSKVQTIQDDGLVAAEIVVDNPGSISAWETVNGDDATGELSLTAASASSGLSTFSAGASSGVSLLSDDDSTVQEDIAGAWKLLDDCTITIEGTESGTPTISAKSGVLAVYGTVNTENANTNLVQATMVRTTGSSWSVYPMETPGAVTIGSGDTADTIGQLGYGYASVAGTGITAQNSVSMTFGESSLKNVLDDSTTFTTTGSGFESFYVTPQELPISGTVALTGDNNGTAVVGDTLTADLTGLSPVRAKDRGTDGSYIHLSFQWYRDGEIISGATGTTYKLVEDDSGKIITCVVSVKTGDTMFTGNVTSSVVLVGTTNLAAPELASRTTTSLTLVDKGTGYTYSKDYGLNWQGSTTFENLTKGTAYTFIQKSGDAISAAATFYTLSDMPESGDFSIDYEAERLSFPEGVLLYSDEDCTTCLNQYSPRTWIDISDYTGTTLYARYSTVDASDTESVTLITIPARPVVSEVTATVTETAISFTGADGVAYRLTLDDAQVGEVKTGDGTNSIEFTGLQPGTEYVLTMRKEVSNTDPGNFRSAQVNQTIRTKGSYAKDSTLLVKAGESSRSYDLSSLLGGLNIDTVTATIDSFVNSATQDTTTSNSIALTFSNPTVGATTTVTVIAKDADSTLTLTLTVKAVEVMVEQNGVFWAKEEIHPGYVGMDENELNSVWNQGLTNAGLSGAPVRHTFAMLPQYIVGGGAANVTDAPQATYQNNDIAAASSGGLLRVGVNATAAETVTETLNKEEYSVTFDVTGSYALYMLALMNTQTPTVGATLKKDSTETTVFQYGDTLTAEITVSTPAGTIGTPTGTVELWLGDATTGTKLGTGELANGKATITYELGDGLTYSNDTRTLNVVYKGDNIYQQTTKEIENITLRAAPPAAPMISAEAAADSVTVKWETPAANGSDITGYTLTVTQNGSDVTGSPFSIEAGKNEYRVEGLQQQTTYRFILKATNDAGSTNSDAITATTLSASSRTILVPAGEKSSLSYFLSNNDISGVTVTEGAQDFIGQIEPFGSYVTLHYDTTNVPVGTTATLKVTSSGIEMTVTAKVVDVVQRNDYYFWVRESLASGDTKWDGKLQELGMSGAGKFTLQNQQITTGQTVPISSTSVSVDTELSNPSDYSFVVLGVDSSGTVYKVSSPSPSSSTFSFTSKSKYTQYLIAWQERQATTIDVTLSGGTADNTFEQGTTITAHVTVSSSSGTPAGIVTVYKGTAASQYQLGSETLTDGKADIQLYPYSLQEGEQTLTFVYGANGNYKSASITKTITLVPAGTNPMETILLPVGSGIEREYDLSALLDGAKIKTVAEGTDSDNILSSVANEGSTLKLTGSAAAEGKTAAVTVTAEKTDGSTLTLNLTVQAVTVLAEQGGAFFVQEYAKPSLVGMTDAQEMLNAWNDAKNANGFQNTETQHSFAIQPRNIIGGDAATNAAAATVTWTPSGNQTPVSSGSFLVLQIGQGNTAAKAISYSRAEDSLTFTADGTAALYCVVYKEATGGAVTLSAKLQKNGVAASSFRYGETLTVVVTIESNTSTGGLKPGGSVDLYLGDPDAGGKFLASGQISNGSGTISYTLNNEGILSNAEQTLYVVYPGDNNHLGGEVAVKAYLQPASTGGGSSLETIEVVETDGGSVEVDPQRAKAGTEITVTPKPDEGKVINEVIVTDKDGNSVDVTDNGDGTWTFVMPEGGATVAVTFRCDGGELCPSRAFSDVNTSAWYHGAIDWAIENGVLHGYAGTDLMGPGDTVTRAQMAAMLWNAAGQPAPASPASFSDLAEGAWYLDAVAWAAETGAFSGYGYGTQFGPDDPLTREQAATVLMRCAAALGQDTSAGADLSGYPDGGDVSSWASEPLSWAVGAGVINGIDTPSGVRELGPQVACSRAQIAAILMNWSQASA